MRDTKMSRSDSAGHVEERDLRSIVWAAMAAACLTWAVAPTMAFAQGEEPAAEEQVEEEAPMAEEPAAEPAPAPAPAAAPAPKPAAGAAGSVEAAPAAEAESKKDVEEFFVTGSRIRRIDVTTPAPVTVLSRDQIDAAGRISIGEILQNLPYQSNAINVQFNNGGDGSTRINLRGLGAERTLVLLNGRRFVPGGIGANSSVDLNTIPAEIVERVEVLKDGASAIYGSDAIGGVVNIITRSDFAGVEASAYAGASQHGGLFYNLGVTAGETTERANIILSFQYFRQQDILADARPFSISDLAYDFLQADCSSGAPVSTAEDCDGIDTTDKKYWATLGSSATPQGTLYDYGEDVGNEAWDSLVARENDSSRFYLDPTAGWRRFNPAGTSDSGQGDLYNYQPENYLFTPSTRLSFFSIGHIDVSEKVTAYFEAIYNNRKSDQLLAPEPLFTISEGLAVSRDNIYNPFGRDFIDIRRRLVEFGNRSFAQDLDTYRGVLGLEGGFPDNMGPVSKWHWDANFIYGRTAGTETKNGLIVRDRLAGALGPSFVDDTGTPVCGTRDNPNTDCVPINLFGGPGTISQEMVDNLTYTGVARGSSTQLQVNLTVDGELFELNDLPVAMAIGYHYRDETGSFQPDPLTARGNTTGNKGEATNGGYDVNAAFIELSVPLLARIPGIELFEITGAFRAFSFSTFGFDNMWKLGARWQIIKDVAVRGTFSRAFRAPAIEELFSGQSDSFPNVTDPCSSEQGPTAPGCQPNEINQDERAQLRSLVGGNPNLDPETANIITAGVVFTPTMAALEGFSVAVDYFTIDIDNSIQPKSASVILSSCYGQMTRSEADCAAITRDPTTGLITVINDLESNIGGAATAGVDFSVRYNKKQNFGRLGAYFDLAWLQKFNNTQPDGRVVQGKGVYDLGAFPEWRFNVTGTYGIGNLNTGVNLRYISGFDECEDVDCSGRYDTDPDTGAEIEGDPRFRRISFNTTVDLFASYGFSNPLGLTTLTAGINNIFDSAPPKIDGGFLANSDAATYDYLGRYFYVNLRQNF